MTIITAEGLTNLPNKFDRSVFSKLVFCTGQHDFVEHILSKKKEETDRQKEEEEEEEEEEEDLFQKQRRIITSFNTGNGAEDCSRVDLAIVSSTQQACAILPDN